MQSNHLLNIRLESDNSTLIWSKPAWDIKNMWLNSLSNPALQAAKNETTTSLSNENNSAAVETQITLMNNSSNGSFKILRKPGQSRFRKNRPPLISAATSLGATTLKKSLFSQFNTKNQYNKSQYNKSKSRLS